MAFDLQQFLGKIFGQQPQAGGNMLANPAQAQQPNQLLAAQAQPAPAMASPQPQQPSGGGFMDKLNRFQESDMSGRLNDMFTGWAMGGTPNESLGRGAMMVQQGNQTRKGKQAQNQTVEWLKTQGMGDGEAKLMAGSPPALNEFLKSRMGGEAKPLEINGQLIDPNTYEVIGDFRTKDNNEIKPTSSIQEYQFAVNQGYKGTFPDYEKEMKKAGASNVNVGFNASEATAAAFADRATNAEKVLSETQSEGTNVGNRALSSLPFGAGNMLVDENYQLFDQAKRDFVNAILRKESGAVISPSEFQNADVQYFPQPGDSDAVIKQKAANRKTAIGGLNRAAGPSYAPPGIAPPTEAGAVDYTDYFKQ